ncbi:hypothetical protein [Kibdelosporangium phytohabitans]|uniref:Uncharacterized protein n=1 Tax=Kibdelosporangium phytohabitans TaxID=860235 RepID=A0A0N9I0A2_9PSEU|nr:hypothetical protein [Kibdelosporangium phytohabitans]ALG08088.1 hypothetical protein AOZ06_15225 [Kibdelosporangium phytohabitans]MBE1470936.1 hypothetical protein [Kibdelosporangium phytohabitans]
MRDECPLAQIRARARALVAMARDGDTTGLVDALDQLLAEQATGGPGPHQVVGELISAAVQMVELRAGDVPAQTLFAVDIRDDSDEAVAIDHLEPPLRATIRALLAELNGHPDDARFQLELALRDIDLESTLEVVVHALLWTIGMLEWCEEQGVDAPDWLRGAGLAA